MSLEMYLPQVKEDYGSILPKLRKKTSLIKDTDVQILNFPTCIFFTRKKINMP